MANIKFSGNKKVGTLCKEFKEAFGGTLRVYNGRSLADENDTLSAIRKEGTNGGELIVKGNMLVGNFEKKVMEMFGIRVQVANVDNTKLAADDITIAAAGREEDSIAPSKPQKDTATPTTSELQFTVNGVSFKMIKVDGGTFTMGAHANQEDEADDDENAHSVTLSSYYIAETEVTQALWQAVMGNNPSSFQDDVNNPVEQVSYDDCKEFIGKLNTLTHKKFRLPTEAEWEFAARGGNKSKDYIYAGSSNLDEVAWYDDWDDGHAHPVKTKAPNELGLYDMSGNVWEWCNDWYGDYPSTAQTNPQGPTSGSYRVYRGGSWCSDARDCRSSCRYNRSPDGRDGNLGFRLSLSE